MFITLTNASELHNGNKIALKISEIVSIYNTTVTRENGNEENVTFVFAPPHGTWEVSEALEHIVTELNTWNK
jgi:hypothetical protein